MNSEEMVKNKSVDQSGGFFGNYLKVPQPQLSLL